MKWGNHGNEGYIWKNGEIFPVTGPNNDPYKDYWIYSISVK
jgi:hypothetical protein